MSAVQALDALMIRDFRTAYGKTPLALLWAVAEPVIGIFLLTVVFSQISSVPPMGSSYALFYATGYLPFLAVTGVLARTMSAPAHGRSILTHASVTMVDVIGSRALLQSLVTASIAALVYAGVWIFEAPAERPDLAILVAATLLCCVLGACVGLLNAGLTTVFPPWARVWGVIMRPLFLISGVFYPFAIMPPALQDVLWWNPILHLVGLTRYSVYQGYEGGYVSVLFVCAVSLVSAVAGLALLFTKKD